MQLGIVCTEGIITKEVKYGETSRIVTLITKDFGKISAIANNVRTGKARLLSGLSLFVFSEFVLYEGKGKNGLFRINEINVKESFRSLRESIDKMAYASYFADVTNKTVTENSPDNELLSLLLNTLYMLDRDGAEFELLKAVFEIKTAQICGYAPSFYPCGKCGSVENIIYLDPVGGCGCCKNCGMLLKKSFLMNNTVRELWDYILNSGLKQSVSVKAKKEIIDYLSRLTESYLSVQLDYEFKTLKFLKNVMAV